jgi:hypothetical protein
MARIVLIRSSAEHSIMRELAAVELLGFAGPGLGVAALEVWNPDRFGAGSARRRTVVPPRHPGSESLEDAILDVAAARRRARIPATTVAAIVRMVPAPPRPPRSSSGPEAHHTASE